MGQGAVARQGRRQGDFLAGKYLLEDCLGIGGMGEVYRATNVSLGRKVAIKLLSPEYVHIEEDVLRFLREARAAAAVRHSNVVDVLDVARDDDGTPFIVEELLSGEDLEHYLTSRNGPISCEEALEIMIPVADAVAAAHAQSVVHRDLKPANIFLAQDRNRIIPKVLDFGACLFPTLADRSAKELRMLIGTPHYMAPEQIMRKQDVDARSDVWALGVILYEMIVGETPFEAETANDVLHLVKTRPFPLLSERVKDAPPGLEELIARCTSRDRLARFEDARALHRHMLEVRQGMRGSASSRRETLMEVPAQHSSADGALLFAPGVPALTAKAPEPMRPPLNPSSRATRQPVAGDRSEPRSALDRAGMRELETDEIDASPPLYLAARPSSWPPASKQSSIPPRGKAPSSLPPVLDPRGAGAWAQGPLPAALLSLSEGKSPARARTLSSSAIATAPSNARPSRPWSAVDTVNFIAAIGLPAFTAFIALRAIPALGAPIGRALRGDSMFASAVLTVVALVLAAALCARSFLGEKSRWVYVAAAGGLLFGIVMIIVTFAASEAAELGVPSSMGGLSSLVAPIAPMALGLGALSKARAAWGDPHSRREATRFALVASALLFLMLALSPVGVVRTPSRPHVLDPPPARLDTQ